MSSPEDFRKMVDLVADETTVEERMTVERIIKDAKLKYASSFKGLHILWNGRLL